MLTLQVKMLQCTAYQSANQCCLLSATLVKDIEKALVALAFKTGLVLLVVST